MRLKSLCVCSSPDMKILYFGDVVGKVGRAGVRAILPQWIKEYQPDLIIANAENVAHGAGITPKTVHELQQAGVQFFTSGNHVWDKPNGEELLQESKPVVIRPENYGSRRSGKGIAELEIGGKKVLIINLQGQVFMKEEVDNPFLAANHILASYPPHKYAAIFVDFHAETTSEKVALGWHLDGRVSCVVGSHTHVPTADARILPDGTAYISDVGMVGPKDSVIGVDKDVIVKRFVTGEKIGFRYAEEGVCMINAVLLETGEDYKAVNFTQLQTEIAV